MLHRFSRQRPLADREPYRVLDLAPSTSLASRLASGDAEKATCCAAWLPGYPMRDHAVISCALRGGR
jgi:hypothetical protein